MNWRALCARDTTQSRSTRPCILSESRGRAILQNRSSLLKNLRLAGIRAGHILETINSGSSMPSPWLSMRRLCFQTHGPSRRRSKVRGPQIIESAVRNMVLQPGRPFGCTMCQKQPLFRADWHIGRTCRCWVLEHGETGGKSAIHNG